MSLRTLFSAGLACAAALAAAGDGSAPATAPAAASAPAPVENPVLPGFKLASLDGRVVDTAAEQRGRPLLIAYWAHWCIPCNQEAPRLRALKREWGERLLLIGIAASDGQKAPDARAFVKKYALNYPNVYDADGGLAVLYHIEAIPQLLLIAPDGRLLLRTMSVEAAQQALDERFAPPAPVASPRDKTARRRPGAARG